MANGKGGGSNAKKPTNDDRRCRKAWKKNPGVSPKAHNGHTIGGYSIKSHGQENAAALAAMNTRPMNERRAARRARKVAA